ncbi:Aldo/keto reductase [Ascodesmis nigricans]|uniref:Aldo/keto reductase n=1 Tax=Ascodesmis nigricans TaxID=341454 RepID=A0A4S2MYF7_9PEZI|nr:Aldo/keto reductase [Ascodesmis nigricans]
MPSFFTPSRPPLSIILPPLVLGSATFNHQYNTDPFSLPSTTIVHRALASGVRAFDTSPYYGPAETLLGTALQSQSTVPRSSYILQTKCGRISADTFDYSPTWIRKSVQRSCERLGTTYLDVVFCHDVEFVTPAEVVTAVKTLRKLRDEGVVRYVGISGYPTDVLADLSELVRKETGEPLDAVMSYANYTLQNTTLLTGALQRMVDGGVDCVLNGSPLGMGLLRSEGVPIGDMGDFHPAPKELREKCAQAAELVREVSSAAEKLEKLALRFAVEKWCGDGAKAGTRVRPLVRREDGEGLREVAMKGRIGISVAGVSFVEELDELLVAWRETVTALERELMYEKVKETLGEWRDYAWPSPGVGYKQKSRL